MKLLASFEWSVIWDNRGALLHGLKLDVEASLIAIAGATTIGIVLGAVRANWIPFASQLAGVYVEIIRCTPFLGNVPRKGTNFQYPVGKDPSSDCTF